MKPLHLKKIPWATRLPRWLVEWLVRPDRDISAPVAIERALVAYYGLDALKKTGGEAQSMDNPLITKD